MEEDYQTNNGASVCLLVLTTTSSNTILQGMFCSTDMVAWLNLPFGCKYSPSKTKQYNFYVLDLLLISRYKVQKAFPVSVTRDCF